MPRTRLWLGGAGLVWGGRATPRLILAVAVAFLAHLEPVAPLISAFLPTSPLIHSGGCHHGLPSSFTRCGSPPERGGARLARAARLGPERSTAKPVVKRTALAKTFATNAGDQVIAFGKHRGKRIKDVPIDYLKWMVANIDNQPKTINAVKEWIDQPGGPPTSKGTFLKEWMLAQKAAENSGPADSQTSSSGWTPKAGADGAPSHQYNLQLTEDGQLAFYFQPGSLKSIAKMRLQRIEGAQFEEGRFQFNLESYGDVIEIVRKLGPGLTAVPASIAAGLAASKEEDDASVEESLSKLPPTIRKALLPFQKEGVRYALKHGGKAMIADEMGLGKTVQGLAVAAVFRDEWPLLVLCPASIRLQWAAEIPKWLPELVSESDVTVVSSKKDPVDGKVVVCSYDLFRSVVSSFKKKPRVVIADESHYLKSASAKRTQACVPIIRKADRAILLSGTPALARPSELFSQLHGLRPTLFTNALDYEDRYCDPKDSAFGRDISGADNLQELNRVLENVMIRRRKSEVLGQLPEKTYQTIYLPISETSMNDLKKMFLQESEILQKQKNKGSGDDGGGTSQEQTSRDNQNKIKSLLAKMRVMTGLAKLPAASEYVTDLVAGGSKVLVFAHHISVLDGLEAAVKKSKNRYIRIDGSVSQKKRQAMVEEFQRDESMRVAVLGLTAASLGLTLTAANTVVFAEMDWTPGVHAQAEDRAHRIGQEQSVDIHYLIAKGTIDERIWKSNERKEWVMSNLLPERA